MEAVMAIARVETAHSSRKQPNRVRFSLANVGSAHASSRPNDACAVCHRICGNAARMVKKAVACYFSTGGHRRFEASPAEYAYERSATRHPPEP